MNYVIEVKIMNSRFLTPVITAFDKDGNVDKKGNINIWNYVMEGGIDGIVLLGSTGEFFAISMEQKKELILLAAEHIKGRLPLYVGISGMEIEDTIELAQYVTTLGIDGVLIVPPYYFALSDEAIEAYYRGILEKTDCKVYLYNFPARTGYDLKPKIALRLRQDYYKVVGYKDTVLNMDHTRELIKTMEEFPDFEILSGFDDNFAHNVLSGGAGAIGGLSNIYPELFSEWVAAFRENNLRQISSLQKKVDILTSLYEIGVPFVPVIKKAMMLKGVEIQDYCTYPILQVTEEQTEKIKKILSKIESL